jgi:type IV pilus assembly protein PilV
MKQLQSNPRAQAGATLIEVLVSILILMIGLLGLVGVMVQSQRAQYESFQRQQAVQLAQDMVERMKVTRAVAGCYVLTDHLGVDMTTVPAAGTCTTGTVVQANRFSADMAEWLAQLQGAGEVLTKPDATTVIVGGVPFARGCVTRDAITGIYQVSVAWQGSVAISAPPAGITCGQNSYGTDAARRAVALTVLL